jgi:hypothetical protein
MRNRRQRDKRKQGERLLKSQLAVRADLSREQNNTSIKKEITSLTLS